MRLETAARETLVPVSFKAKLKHIEILPEELNLFTTTINCTQQFHNAPNSNTFSNLIMAINKVGERNGWAFSRRPQFNTLGCKGQNGIVKIVRNV